MIVVISDKALAQLRKAGLRRPRPPQAGQEWKPRTDPEAHLLREACRLDRLRLVLLEEVGRLRQEAGHIPRREAIAAAARTADRLRECPLTQQMLAVVAAAAAGEAPEETASRLCLAYETVKSHRRRAVLRLGARNIPHAVALCVQARWVTTVGQAPQGVTP